MRKWIISAAALLLAALLLVLCTPLGLPATAELEPVAAQKDSDTLYLTENRTMQSRIYTADEKGRVREVYQEGRRGDGLVTSITQLACGSDGVYFIRQTCREGSLASSDWQLCLLEEDGTVTELGGGEDALQMRVTGLGVSSGTIRVAGVDSPGRAVVCALPESGGDWDIQIVGDMGRVVAAQPDGDALLVQLGEGGALRISSAGAATVLEAYPQIQFPGQISISFSARLACKWDFLAAAVIAVAVVLVLALAVRRSTQAKTLALRTACLTGVCLFITLLVVTAALVAGTGGLRTGENMDGAVSLTQSRARLLEQAGPEAVLQEDFYGSVEAAALEQLMGTGDELYAVSGGEATVALSRQAVWGSSAAENLTGASLELMDQVLREESAGAVTIRSGGRQIIVSAAPVSANGVLVGVLVSRTAAELSLGDMVSLLGVVGSLLGGLFLVSLLLIYLFLRRTTRPVAAITEQMKAVSEGNLRPAPISKRRDELGELNRAMQEMCMGLSIRDYEVDSVIQAYRRFVPWGMERLLDRASVMEVSFRDARTLTGSMGLFSVNNRDRARQALEDEDYVQFVSNCFRMLRESAKAHQGQMLAGSFELDAAPVFYPEDTGSAVQAGLDLMGELERQPAVQGWRPDYFLMLHYTSFLYGIAGTEDRVFPLISSSEMEFLGSFADRFRSAGVRMVLTEDILNRLTIGCNTRYIGYVASADGRHSFKLYEALDTYQDIERNLRIRYDQRLQEGIRLFYHNDFYLARNLFSSLLKACPQDGVVRWYLFACEYFFNSDPGQVDYRLFGIDQ
ncbi:HAMP domain-containing protein [Pseudoflavonifractor phocaeensis]|uniref:HAMP domain-containing protein n=1 Tax=Pseudoflavonifractor phocaeensis TaxID=1870988 RepID=UPI00195D2B6F|nr:HAMP domain-containing protein [Pseudoflavonifractor phocaeensis]MBM6924795.1 HAMP domain-containing protein [Pseudoflavonifractor phocaeensis]